MKKILYVEAKFDERSMNRIKSFQESIKTYLGTNDLELVEKEDFHTTIIYSEKIVPYKEKDVKDTVLKLSLRPKIWNVRGGEENIVVLTFENDFIENRHHYGRHIGATSTYKVYRPHITIINKVGDISKKDFIESLCFDTFLVLEKENVMISTDY